MGSLESDCRLKGTSGQRLERDRDPRFAFKGKKVCVGVGGELWLHRALEGCGDAAVCCSCSLFCVRRCIALGVPPTPSSLAGSPLVGPSLIGNFHRSSPPLPPTAILQGLPSRWSSVWRRWGNCRPGKEEAGQSHCGNASPDSSEPLFPMPFAEQVAKLPSFLSLARVPSSFGNQQLAAPAALTRQTTGAGGGETFLRIFH